MNKSIMRRLTALTAAPIVAASLCFAPLGATSAARAGGISSMLPGAAGGANDQPSDQPAQQPAAPGGFEGVFAGNGIRMEIHRDADRYSGTITRGQRQFPFTAHVEDDSLIGSFTSGGAQFEFSCKLAGNELTFSSGGTSIPLEVVSVPPQPATESVAGPAAAPQGAAQTGAPQAGGNYLLFQPATLHDNIANCDAATLLVPKGWQTNVNIVWRNDPFYPVVVRGSVSNPNGPESVNFYPISDFCCAAPGRPAPWGSLAAFLNSRGEGNRYIGMEIHHLLTTPRQYLQEIIIPRYRPDLANATLISDEDHPELAQAAQEKFGNIPGMKCKVSRIRMAYTVNGTELEEDFLITLCGYPAPGNTFDWGATTISYRAAKGKVDQNMGIFRTITDSVRTNIEWYNLVQQAKSALQQIIQHEVDLAAQLSRYLAQCNREITRSIRESYEHQQAVEDRCAERFDQVIRGVDTYENPYGGKMEVPAGYDHVYISAGGDVIVSNDPSFNINKVAGNWQEAHK